jgi:hypothetical protein
MLEIRGLITKSEVAYVEQWGKGSSDPQCDARGNLRLYYAGGLVSYRYTYDWANRLIKVEVDGGVGYETTGEYTYDALSRRVTNTDRRSETTTRYVYDGGQVIEEYDPDATPSRLRSYVYGSYVDDPLVMGRSRQPRPRQAVPIPQACTGWKARATTANRGQSRVFRLTSADDGGIACIHGQNRKDRRSGSSASRHAARKQQAKRLLR